MITNKKRKFDAGNELKNISAFAAKSRLQAVQNDKVISHGENQYELSKDPFRSQDEQQLDLTCLNSSSTALGVFEADIQQSLHQSQRSLSDVDYLSDAPGGENGISIEKSPAAKSRTSGALDLEKPEIPFTTINLTGGNVRGIGDGNCVVEIAAGERLVVLGEYGLSVLDGQITLLGATLSASDTVYDVYAPLSHSLPVIRYSLSDKSKAEICLHHRSHGLRSLDRISPLFAGIWSLQSSHQGIEEYMPQKQQGSRGGKQGSFQIISSIDKSPRQTAYPIIYPAEWNEQLHASTSKKGQSENAPVIMICGPKSSGKSTFARLMVNHMVTGNVPVGRGIKSDFTRINDHSVAFLDLDPGQPEYSPPGQVSLIWLSKPQFGPPYSHSDSSPNGRELIRAHSIVAFSPSADPSLYRSCMVDLLTCYAHKTTETPCPLIINTPGWILGSGLEILIDIIKEARPSKILYMSQQGPSEVVEGLQEVAKQIPLVTLPSQPAVKITRTAAQLRKMQYMSYFHLDPGTMTDHFWTASPLTSMAPWEVKYAGDGAGILGVMCLGEPPLPAMVRDTIDGTVLVVVALDDIAVTGAFEEDNFGHIDKYHMQSIEREASAKKESQMTKEWIIQTPEGIPYINREHAKFLDPKYSYTIGLALLRGIDSDRKVFQLLTPISEKTIKDTKATGKAVVLLSSKLDTPDWAYLEEFYDRASGTTEASHQLESDYSDDDNEDSAVERIDLKLYAQNLGKSFEDTPWIERSYGDQGRGAGARVWRVRRDLGKAVESR